MPEIVVDNLHFPEGPRWRDGRLYFSDFYQHKVLAMSPAGELDVVVEVPQQPSGLGWMPDGRLLIVSMLDRKLMRFDGRVLEEHADLNPVAAWYCNDMVVDAQGRAYVGNFGFDTQGDAEERLADLALVYPDGHVVKAAEGLAFPNGSVITPDGRTLVVAETRANRLSAFDIAPDGTLSGRRVWADLGGNFPDGICLDADGAIWVADPRNHCVLRVHEGGRRSREIDTAQYGAFACMLGGETGSTLYICTALASGLAAQRQRAGRIERVDVDVPRAGLP